MNLQIRQLSYALGAEIIGIDIRKLDTESFSAVHAAFLEHGVLLFRGLPLTQEQHVAFSRWFGELDTNDTLVKKPYPEYPEIALNRPAPSTKPSDYEGNHWHTDRARMPIPAMASILRGVEIPTIGGDTMFANMYLAYEALSDGMKKLLQGLYGVHFGNTRMDYRTPDRAVAQPLVRAHPETGRTTLYLTERMKQIVDMTMEESRPLLEFLCQHATRPQFVYRHQWQKDDLIMWDNRCMMHKAVGDYDGTQIRHMERTVVLGTAAGAYVYEGPVR